MAGASGGIRAGKTFVEAYLDDSKLAAGLKAAEAKLKAWGSGVTAVGASLAGVGSAITTGFLGAAATFADTGSELNDMSARTGMSVEGLSALGHAATQTGTDLSTVEGGVRKMQKALVAGSEENMQAEATFASLGLSVKALERLSPEQQFNAIAKSVSAIPNPTAKAAAAMSIFGKSGTALLPMMDDLDALTKEAKDLGLVMSTQDASAADALGDAMDNVKAMLKQVVVTIGASLAPILTELAGTMMRVIKTSLDWVNANRPLIAVAFQVGAGILAAGGAFIALGGAITGIGVVMGGIATGIGVVGSIIGALLSPIGLVVAAVVGLGYVFLNYTEVGQKALAWLGDSFNVLKADAVAAFGGIADALKAGDIALAGKILWAALRIQFIKGINFLQDIWSDWGGFATDVFRRMQFSVASIMTDMWAGIQRGSVNSTGFLSDAFISFIGALKKSWNSFGGFFAEVWEQIKAQFKGGDVDVEVAKISAETAAKNAAVDKETGATVAGRQRGRDAQLSQINEGQSGAQKALADQRDSEEEARRKAAQELRVGRGDKLAEAKKEFDALRSDAAAKRLAVPEAVAAKKAGEAPEEFTPQNLDKSLDKSKEKVDVKGGFSAAAIRGMGAGDSVTEKMDEVKKEQEKTNKQLEKTHDLIAKKRAVYN